MNLDRQTVDLVAELGVGEAGQSQSSAISGYQRVLSSNSLLPALDPCDPETDLVEGCEKVFRELATLGIFPEGCDPHDIRVAEGEFASEVVMP